ncbi:MAG TPA: serine protease [Longimicrobium sp.]
MRWMAMAVLAACTAAGGVRGQAPGTESRLQSAARLIVAVEGVRKGAGIIVGFQGDSVYVATARHVLATQDSVADSIRLRFHARPDLRVPARLVELAPDLDLALISAPVDDVSRVRPELIPFYRLGRGRLKQGTHLYPLGCPDSECWEVPAIPTQFQDRGARDLSVMGYVIQAGHSGGGLFTRKGTLMGLVLEHALPTAHAIPIDTVLGRVRAWGVSPALQRERRPYLFTVGGMMAMGFGGDSALTSGMRGHGVEVQYHAFAVRLQEWWGVDRTTRIMALAWAPAWVYDGVRAGAFFEAGRATHSRRRDLGGYWVAGPDGEQYLPVMWVETTTRLVPRVGAQLEYQFLGSLLLGVYAAMRVIDVNRGADFDVGFTVRVAPAARAW